MILSNLLLTGFKNPGLTIFILHVYVKAWFTPPLPVSCPMTELILMKLLVEYNEKSDTVESSHHKVLVPNLRISGT